MRFLVDECTGPRVARWLTEQGHEVYSVYDTNRGISDDTIIEKAYAEKWILITVDKDFGAKIYRDQYAHHGVILLRLGDERAQVKIQVLEQLLAQYSDRLQDRFVVATEKRVRLR